MEKIYQWLCKLWYSSNIESYTAITNHAIEEYNLGGKCELLLLGNISKKF